MSIDSPAFWLALGQIVWINIILSGDNAVVIALVARSLPPKQQKMAIAWGSGAAVVLRIVLTFIAAYLLKLPYLQIIGGLLLLWIGYQLISEEGGEGEGDGHAKEGGNLMVAESGQCECRGVGCKRRFHLAGDRLGDQHSVGGIRQHPDDQADGAFPRDCHSRRCPDRLGGG